MKTSGEETDEIVCFRLETYLLLSYYTPASIYHGTSGGPDPFMPCSPLGCHSAALVTRTSIIPPVQRHHLLHETSFV